MLALPVNYCSATFHFLLVRVVWRFLFLFLDFDASEVNDMLVDKKAAKQENVLFESVCIVAPIWKMVQKACKTK